MLEIVRNIELMAARLNADLLYPLGLTAVIFGLFIWLGGLGFRRTLASVIGLTGGAIYGLFVAGGNVTLTILLLMLGTAIALVFERILVARSAAGRLLSAICCATLGTALVFTGMMLLLLHEGTMPVIYIRSRQSFYAIAFVATIALGTTEQLLFCQYARVKSTAKKQPNKDTQEDEKKPQSWRT